MTAICSAKLGDYVALIGDVLLSGPETASSNIRLPTHQDTAQVFPHGSGYIIKGLRQKLYQVNANLILAWAGSYIHARALADLITNRIGARETSQQELEGLIRTEGQHINLKDIAVIFHLHRNGRISTFGLNVSMETDNYSDLPILYAGSGGDAVKDEILTLKNQTNNDYMEHTLSLYGSLYLRDLVAPSESLVNYFGGSYEMAIFNQGQFQKTRDITLLFWSCNFDENGDGFYVRLRKILKNSYSGEIFLVRDVTTELVIDSGDLALEIENQTLHGIGTLFRNATYNDLQNAETPDFSSGVQANYFAIFIDNKFKRFHIHFGYHKTDQFVTFKTLGDNKFDLSLKKEKLEETLRNIAGNS